ncbi:NfeD family protein [Acidianus sp. HS-5]|uniref:NfeD family protein n=1 Tax=Acidianus sp. HS-5 TaxID=2886040 RepID=UPI001F261765|nr:NfeD family protein [Acidianus sp. HS-5]BDC18371.1 serine protease [Acidianus sp. HS-5]
MVHYIVIPIIIIIVLIIILVITGYISDPIIDIPSFAIIGFLSYRIVYVIIKTRKRNLYSYKGKIGKAVDDIPKGKEGYVLIEGEYWKAIAEEPIVSGDEVVVIGMQDLKLIVRKNKNNEVII